MPKIVFPRAESDDLRVELDDELAGKLAFRLVRC
jgi:hypothetical protein